MSPLVTIGMPTYNRADVLEKSIDSVLNQTFSDFELIIYDDGSTDNTLQILQSYKDERLTFISLENSGPPNPLNYIYENAKGNFIMILHDHDFFSSQLIEKCLFALQSHPDAGFALPGGGFVDDDGKSNYVEMLENLPLNNCGWNFLIEILENGRSFSTRFHACSMVRRTALEKCGFFYNKKYGWHSDVDLWMRLLKDHDFLYLKEPLIKFTRREEHHELNIQQVRTVNNMYTIHYDNITRNFTSPSELKKFYYFLNQRYFIEIFKAYITQISTGNEDIMDQAEELNTVAFNKVSHRFLFYLLKFNLVSHLLVFFRKLFRL